MDTLTTTRPATTVAQGREIPEADLNRGNPKDTPFQVREAVTVRLGPRPRRGAEPEIPPGRTFEVRSGLTITLTPPHWAKLIEKMKEGPTDVDVLAADANSRKD